MITYNRLTWTTIEIIKIVLQRPLHSKISFPTYSDILLLKMRGVKNEIEEGESIRKMSRFAITIGNWLQFVLIL